MVFHAAYFVDSDGVDGHGLPRAAVLADADAEIGVEGGHAFACWISDYCGRGLQCGCGKGEDYACCADFHRNRMLWIYSLVIKSLRLVIFLPLTRTLSKVTPDTVRVSS